MDSIQIRLAASSLQTRKDLLDLLNSIKKDELGDTAHPFTMKQLNYFCNPNKCFSSFKTFTIPKKSGAPRTICAPTKIHKSLLVYVNRILQSIYCPSDSAMGFVPGRSVVTNAQRHINHNYVLNLDLKDFFPSIPQARVWAVLQIPPFSFNKEIAGSIAGMCSMRINDSLEDGKHRYRYVLPQGSPASPILTNIVCQKLDRRLSGLAKKFGVAYTRYADDITFSSNHSVYASDGEFMKELQRIIADQNFVINESKTRLQKKGSRQEVTGLLVSSKVNVFRSYTRDLGSLLYVWERYGYAAANMSFIRNYSGRTPGTPSMEKVIQGKLMYLKMVKGDTDHVWQKLQTRFQHLLLRNNGQKSGVVFTLFTKKICDFEIQTGMVVDFKNKANVTDGIPSIYAIITEPDTHSSKEFVSLSKASIIAVEKALSEQDTSAINALKSILYISLCSGENGQFWRIMKCNPSVISKEENIISDEDFTEPRVDPDDNLDSKQQGISTADVLRHIFESNDLTIIEKWNTTNNI